MNMISQVSKITKAYPKKEELIQTRWKTQNISFSQKRSAIFFVQQNTLYLSKKKVLGARCYVVT